MKEARRRKYVLFILASEQEWGCVTRVHVEGMLTSQSQPPNGKISQMALLCVTRSQQAPHAHLQPVWWIDCPGLPCCPAIHCSAFLITRSVVTQPDVCGP